METLATIFARRIPGHPNLVRLLDEDGNTVTQLADGGALYPLGSELSARYEHPGGIIITVSEALELGIEIED